MLRGVEIPLERTGSNSRGYFSEVLPKLLSILTEQEIQNLRDISFCRKHIRACLETHLSIMKRFNSMLAMAI